jgi:cell division protein FtsB
MSKVRDQFHTSGLLWSSVAIAGFIVMVNGIQRGGQSFSRLQELDKRYALLQERITGFRLKNSQLEKEIGHIEQDPDYAAKILRDQYHLTAPGEEFIFVPEIEY